MHFSTVANFELTRKIVEKFDVQKFLEVDAHFAHILVL